MDKDNNVNHPKHYTLHPSGIECIVIVEHMTFNIGNAVKYLWRVGLKGDHRKRIDAAIEDLQKAAWYVNREIARLESEKEEETHREAARSVLRERKEADKQRASEVKDRIASGTETPGNMETKV